jgi:hypothetical protein
MARKPLPKWFERLAMVNIGLIILVRLMLIVPIDAVKKVKVVDYYFGTEQWAKQIHEKAGDYPVIFNNSFQTPSRYNYYTRSTKGFSYDSRYYRKNQYDIWPLEDSLRNSKAYFVLPDSHGDSVKQDTINTRKGVFYGLWIDKVRMYQKVSVNPVVVPEEWKSGEVKTLKLKITNPYNESISFGNAGETWKCYLEYAFKRGDNMDEFKPVLADIENIKIGAGASVEVEAAIKAPVDAGKYKMILSLRTEPFSGGRNSNMIGVDVK